MIRPETVNELDKWYDALRQTLCGPGLIDALKSSIECEFDADRLRLLSIYLAREYIAQGNQAAAAAIQAKDPLVEVHHWHDGWREANSDADIVPVLETRIREESHPTKLKALRYLLADEFRDRGEYASATGVYLNIFDNDPGAPMPLIILAGQKFNEEEQPEEALRIVDRAVEVALRSGTFRRHALGTKARIALHLRDFRTVEGILRQLMDLQFTRGNFDIQRERDFLDALPPGSIDPEVARRYDEFCRAKEEPAQRKA